ncbi:MAG TPA: hypothetical protein PKK00_03980 [Bacteroidales bacterium]|nr:hypothetical protein [Bacteroidales bacterium]HPS16535.1 hypothetical protein [Bacteroidales bacterium]
MRNNIILAISFMFLLIIGCTRPSNRKDDIEKEDKGDTVMLHNDLYFSNNMENINCWEISSPKVIKTTGHSGMHCSKINKDAQYSFGFSSKIQDFTTKKIKKALVRVWVSATSMDFDAGIVCDINRNDSSVYWQSSGLKYFVTELGKWFEATGSFKFPDNLTENDRVSIYVWISKGSADIFVDDFEIQFME